MKLPSTIFFVARLTVILLNSNHQKKQVTKLMSDKPPLVVFMSPLAVVKTLFV